MSVLRSILSLAATTLLASSAGAYGRHGSSFIVTLKGAPPAAAAERVDTNATIDRLAAAHGAHVV